MPPVSETDIQREYYASTADRYDDMHLHVDDEQYFALGVLAGCLPFLQAKSVLDVGAGTGRALRYLAEARPGLTVRGVEPVAELRQRAYAAGISPSELTDGDGLRLDFPDASFDVVCEFGVLHHVRTPDRVVSEMLRVARRAIFISDSNNFGQGSPIVRAGKQALRAFGLWPLANAIKTRGRGYIVTEGDGLSYSYSVFRHDAMLRGACRSVHIINTTPAGVNPYRSASHVAVLGIKG
jgi:SAM-dependent methyltransferase